MDSFKLRLKSQNDNKNTKNVNDDNLISSESITRAVESQIPTDTEESLDDAQNTMTQIRNNKTSLDVSEIEAAHNKKRIFNFYVKKIILLIVFILIIIVFLTCEVKNIFFTRQLGATQIAAMANQGNGITRFNQSEVQGYITQNASALLSGNIQMDNGQMSNGDVSYGVPIVTNIILKTDTLANVYFYIDILNQGAPSRCNFMIPLNYNIINDAYSPGSNPMLITQEVNTSTTKISNSPFLKFDSHNQVSNSMNKQMKAFVDNFLRTLYGGEDISPFYKGKAQLKPYNLKYIDMTNFQAYNKPNLNQYNVIATIQLKTTNGLTYVTTKYFNIPPQGPPFIIKGVL